jgi:hypothetical protein
MDSTHEAVAFMRAWIQEYLIIEPIVTSLLFLVFPVLDTTYAQVLNQKNNRKRMRPNIWYSLFLQDVKNNKWNIAPFLFTCSIIDIVHYPTMSLLAFCRTK